MSSDLAAGLVFRVVLPLSLTAGKIRFIGLTLCSECNESNLILDYSKSTDDTSVSTVTTE